MPPVASPDGVRLRTSLQLPLAGEVAARIVLRRTTRQWNGNPEWQSETTQMSTHIRLLKILGRLACVQMVDFYNFLCHRKKKLQPEMSEPLNVTRNSRVLMESKYHQINVTQMARNQHETSNTMLRWGVMHWGSAPVSKRKIANSSECQPMCTRGQACQETRLSANHFLTHVSEKHRNRDLHWRTAGNVWIHLRVSPRIGLHFPEMTWPQVTFLRFNTKHLTCCAGWETESFLMSWPMNGFSGAVFWLGMALILCVIRNQIIFLPGQNT